MPTRRLSSVIILCEQCEKPFHPFPGRAKIMRFCSITCRNEGMRQQLRPMTTLEIAWLAGLFDGEGNILQKTVPGRYKRWLRITVTNTCRPLVDRVAAVTGVGFITTRYHDDPRHQPTHDWHHTGGGAREILGLLEPWLIAKQGQAQQALRVPSPN